MPSEDTVLNNEIESDDVRIYDDPFLYIIDRDKRYSVAKYITQKRTIENLWNMIVHFLISDFTSFPNMVGADRQSPVRSKFLAEVYNQLGIYMKIKPTENHNSSSICERYQSIARRVFYRTRSDYPYMSSKMRL